MSTRTKMIDVSGDKFINALAKYLHQHHVIPHPRKDATFVDYYYFNAATMLSNYYNYPCIPIIPRVVSPRGTSNYKQETENKMMVRTVLILLIESGWIEKHKSGIVFVTEKGREEMQSLAIQLQNSSPAPI